MCAESCDGHNWGKFFVVGAVTTISLHSIGLRGLAGNECGKLLAGKEYLIPVTAAEDTSDHTHSEQKLDEYYEPGSAMPGSGSTLTFKIQQEFDRWKKGEITKEVYGKYFVVRQ